MKYKDLCYAALGAAVICVLSPISIPIGAVPITLSLLAVLLISGILPTKLALPAVACYIALGAVGVPVFAGFMGGAQVLAGPTGGFIMGYLPATLLVPLGSKSKIKTAFFMGLSAILCYIVGSAWLSASTDANFVTTLGTTFITCAIPDALKITAAVLLSHAINDRLTKTCDQSRSRGIR